MLLGRRVCITAEERGTAVSVMEAAASEIDRLEAALAEANAKIAKLREALAPFARCWSDHRGLLDQLGGGDDMEREEREVEEQRDRSFGLVFDHAPQRRFPSWWEQNALHDLRCSHLIAASSALAASAPEGGETP